MDNEIDKIFNSLEDELKFLERKSRSMDLPIFRWATLSRMHKDTYQRIVAVYEFDNSELELLDTYYLLRENFFLTDNSFDKISNGSMENNDGLLYNIIKKTKLKTELQDNKLVKFFLYHFPTIFELEETPDYNQEKVSKVLSNSVQIASNYLETKNELRSYWELNNLEIQTRESFRRVFEKNYD